ncbi:aldo/keto reductase [Natronosalvus caseinilyticus]|uniref:aldo/keto reductase n=1 Tax=Natronosalvus caseinilyticus TaxID=2953747 RepID=UPI0028B13DE7|nr:aldo/keto reductase [Natronosalvus caseinilyticus]
MDPTAVTSPGLGTMGFETPDACTESVRTAIELGYRHVDTAQKYGTEAAVGAGIEAANVPREDLTVATKIEETNLAYDDVIETAAASLDRLGLESVDLLYVHWPGVTYDPEETLPAFDRLVDDGVTNAVGVANFSSDLLAEAREVLEVPIVAHQVEMHPLLHQERLHADALEHDTTLVAYCPLMRGKAFDTPELLEIAADTGHSVVELCLGWLASKKGVVPIPKATGEHHLRENYAATDPLSPSVLERLDAIDREHRVVDPPEKAPWNR